MFSIHQHICETETLKGIIVWETAEDTNQATTQTTIFWVLKLETADE